MGLCFAEDHRSQARGPLPIVVCLPDVCVLPLIHAYGGFSLKMIHRIAVASRTRNLLSVVQSILLIVFITGCGPSPLAVSATPTPAPTPLPPVMITVAYSTEKSDWLTKATALFNQQNKGHINVVPIDARGSLDAVDAIVGKDLNGTPVSTVLQPTIWSPASDLELHWLSQRWEKENPGQQKIIDYTNSPPQYIVHSYLVFAVWQKQSTALSTSPYKNLTWQDIHTLLSLHDWSQIGGDGNLGRVKFGQTQPDLSNSGLMTLTLIAYSYFKKDRDLTPQEIHNDSGFRTFLKDIEDKVQCFGPSSGIFMPTVIRNGPGYFDFVTTYENLVLASEQAAQDRWGQTLVMYYPPRLKMKSDHPFVVLQGKWVSPSQQQAAMAFLKFLKDPAQQRSALTFGLRPESLPITADVPGNR